MADNEPNVINEEEVRGWIDWAVGQNIPNSGYYVPVEYVRRQLEIYLRFTRDNPRNTITIEGARNGLIALGYKIKVSEGELLCNISEESERYLEKINDLKICQTINHLLIQEPVFVQLMRYHVACFLEKEVNEFTSQVVLPGGIETIICFGYCPLCIF